ncbi:ABC transporter substrate-binding protein [Nocardia sp. NPDC051833]|uniref:ABC transporter substrate-binding protein n=1 Tax=Nocardia sp. NPDC051833 TaxID=3155674 RepID=UPI003414117A
MRTPLLAGITAAVMVSGCAAGGTTGTRADGVDLSAFVPSAGAEIPTVPVKFGMKPFPNSTLYSIGLKNGYFKDVGIDIQPQPYGTAVTPDNVVSLLRNGSIDIATMYGPAAIQVLSQVPDLRMFGFSDTYEATYLLASPKSGITPASERIAAGQEPAAAIREAMQSVRGREVAINSSGSQRVFLNSVFTAGGMTFDDVQLNVTDDAKIVALATGGKIDFATPDGAGQNVQLLENGWYPLVSVNDLARVAGNEAVVAASLGHEGPAALDGYLEKNPETAMRFLSVMFRIIDDILGKPDASLAAQLPYLNERSGLNLQVAGLQKIYDVIDPVVPFEGQPKFWDEGSRDPKNYQVVYSEQVAAAKKGGILPDKAFELAQHFVGGKFYEVLMRLKADYDELVGQAATLTGKPAELAAQAAQQYQWRNYLDAYRILKTALAP